MFRVVTVSTQGRTVKDWLVSAEKRMTRLTIQIEDDHLIFARIQPRARDVQSLLRTDVPDSAEGPSIQPHGPFRESAGIQKRVPGRIHAKRGAAIAGALARTVRERKL